MEKTCGEHSEIPLDGQIDQQILDSMRHIEIVKEIPNRKVGLGARPGGDILWVRSPSFHLNVFLACSSLPLLPSFFLRNSEESLDKS